MAKQDDSFTPGTGLEYAVDLLRNPPDTQLALPHSLLETGLGEIETLNLLAPHVLGAATFLDSRQALAHMDPPTPWITWATAQWNARLNQNLLHPSTAPFALEAEQKVIAWLAPLFGMGGGHMCCGSTVANLTALWAARDAIRVDKIVASSNAHISIEKAARILGLPYEQINADKDGRFDLSEAGDVSNACLVLTAGTTATGVIEPLELIGQAKWTHVDAAWSGPLRLSGKYTGLLDGIEQADSVAVSAHKWLFQPKESALILFREPDVVNPAISFGGAYLAAPNIGVQGSRGASAVPLLATMIAWGRLGVAERIDHAMSIATRLAEALSRENSIEVRSKPCSGVTVFRPVIVSTQTLYERLPDGMFSTCEIDGEKWLRSVAANPLADVEEIISKVRSVLDSVASQK